MGASFVGSRHSHGKKIEFDRRPRKRRGHKPVCYGICRDCGNWTPTRAREFTHASPPRCPKCGGLLDKKWMR